MVLLSTVSKGYPKSRFWVISIRWFAKKKKKKQEKRKKFEEKIVLIATEKNEIFTYFLLQFFYVFLLAMSELGRTDFILKKSGIEKDRPISFSGNSILRKIVGDTSDNVFANFEGALGLIKKWKKIVIGLFFHSVDKQVELGRNGGFNVLTLNAVNNLFTCICTLLKTEREIKTAVKRPSIIYYASVQITERGFVYQYVPPLISLFKMFFVIKKQSKLLDTKLIRLFIRSYYYDSGKTTDSNVQM